MCFFHIIIHILPRLSLITSSSDATNSTRKQPKSTETINQNVHKRGNEFKITQQKSSKPTNKSAPPTRTIEQNLVEVKREIVAEEPPTEEQQKTAAENDVDVENMDDGENCYMRSSLQEECLEKLFSKDSPEDVSLMNEKEQKQINGNNVKEEIMSEEYLIFNPLPEMN